MWYKIKPLDTLFFRDGRPFSMGSETWANTLFPPYPSTVYGAIRTWFIFERGGLKDFYKGNYKKELGTKDGKGSLKIKGPFVSLNEEILFSVPHDLVVKKRALRSEKNALFNIDYTDTPQIFISDYSLPKLLINKKDFEVEECDEFIDINSLKYYLMDNKRSLQFIEKKEIFVEEKKTGIKRSRKTLASEEGYLYRIPMIRLKKEASLFVKVEGLKDYPDGGLIKFGGEGKTVKIEKIENADLLETLRDISFKFENKLFRIYLATPALFKKGWLPEWINNTTFEGNYNRIELKLVACAIGKFKLIGGWDLANQKPKPMYKAVPAGSVYYFEILNDIPAEGIKNTFHLQNISDINSEEGFGLALVGEVKE